MKILITLLAFCCAAVSFATTWDEPWQKDILRKADHLVYAEVVSCVDSAMEIRIVKVFGKSDLAGKTIRVNQFYMLDLCSSSEGHGADFDFVAGDRGYALLKQYDNGDYGLPTPTSGFDRILDGQVYATYRHTYHQALIDSADYEMTYTEIWSYVKTGKYDSEKVMRFINEQLVKAPAGFEEDEIATFFLQHVAMEMAYMLEIPLPLEQLKPFTKVENFHAEVSALRAMGNATSKETGDFLLKYIADKKKEPFLLVMAIRSLKACGTKEQLAALTKTANKLSEESAAFGGNIMDPRVCTRLPSPREAALE